MYSSSLFVVGAARKYGIIKKTGIYTGIAGGHLVRFLQYSLVNVHQLTKADAKFGNGFIEVFSAGGSIFVGFL